MILVKKEKTFFINLLVECKRKRDETYKKNIPTQDTNHTPVTSIKSHVYLLIKK